jgi:hypothetical protein
MKSKISSVVKNWFYWIAGAIILMLPAFYNGFPLVYSDTGTYIESGMLMYLPVDRPVFYGLFIKFFSFGVSLWWVVFFQCLMLSFVIHQLFLSFLNHHVAQKIHLIVIFILTAFTSVAWFSAQLMPDIFTPMLVLAILALLIGDKLCKQNKVLLALVILLSILTHYSNLILSMAFGAILLVMLVWSSKKDILPVRYLWQKAFAFSALVLLSFVITVVTNHLVDNRAQISKGSHMFIMGRLLDSGVLKLYLDEHCGQKENVLCLQKDSLPESSRELHWSSNSPVHQSGGWEGSESSYWSIIWDILKQPRYIGFLLAESVKVTFIQLTQNEIGTPLVSDWYGHESSPPFIHIKKFFPHEHQQYLQSRQNTNLWGQTLDFNFLNHISYMMLTISTLFLMLIFLFSNLAAHLLNTQMRFAIFWLLLAIVLNAFITANFSVVCDRLQARVVWLLPLLVLLFLLSNEKLLRRFKLK